MTTVLDAVFVVCMTASAIGAGVVAVTLVRHIRKGG